MAMARDEKRIDLIVLQEVKWMGLSDGRTTRGDEEGGLPIEQMKVPLTEIGFAKNTSTEKKRKKHIFLLSGNRITN